MYAQPWHPSCVGEEARKACCCAREVYFAIKNQLNVHVGVFLFKIVLWLAEFMHQPNVLVEQRRISQLPVLISVEQLTPNMLDASW